MSGTPTEDNEYRVKGPGEHGMHQEETGGMRSSGKGKGRYDLIPPYPLDLLAKHYEAGLEHYPENNWRQGLPLKRYLDSALRHINNYRIGMRDENHLVSAVWNLFGYLATERMIELELCPKELSEQYEGILHEDQEPLRLSETPQKENNSFVDGPPPL